ncbi:pentatricopeptide repeat-containing protein At1g20230-like [Selaginella moellendorffii]|uniref:pentatricopeptide repeat-containing protein At1g20230-like n=1 Tax=Selaginella moellendorffii TaxID=88036 RepID=UPI000D1C6664|nr:pentatricopeptide repeat-containing protein At1g20230-like [Selaginella moellendorffii]|eukprot:XP_024534862.1 pentatricopeptide repeat-containing protein At1g20230-like [Selaginella moellendorffii]
MSLMEITLRNNLPGANGLSVANYFSDFAMYYGQSFITSKSALRDSGFVIENERLTKPRGVEKCLSLSWILANSIYELELQVFEKVVSDSKVVSVSVVPRLEASLRSISLDWLDKHAPNSVLYISFGSVRVSRPASSSFKWLPRGSSLNDSSASSGIDRGLESGEYFLTNIVASISACHADDPGSIPGNGGKKNVSFRDVWVMLTRSKCLDLVQSCKTLPCARQIHATAIHIFGKELDLFLGNKLIEMYGKCGSAAEARAIFDGMSNRDSFSWEIMLAAYSRNRQLDAATEIFETMPHKTLVAWNIMLGI